MNPIYTIGHSSHPIDQFIGLLRRHGIEAVADVRSNPSSRRFPQYNRNELKTALQNQGIRYVFLGRELGARRSEPEAYDGRVASYERIANLPKFREGIERIKSGSQKMKLALMCAERDPLQCHRTILVCRKLPAELRSQVIHILDTGNVETHCAAEQRLVAESGLDTNQDELFASPDQGTALDRAYRKRGERIAWQEEGDEAIHDRLHKEVS
ncbi:MAG: DUF488 domain-containing protein [Steroidobacteraceae bacterium]